MKIRVSCHFAQMTSMVSYLRKHSPNFLKSLILVEIEDSLKIVSSQFPPLLKKKCKMMHFEIILVKINVSSSIDEL